MSLHLANLASLIPNFSKKFTNNSKVPPKPSENTATANSFQAGAVPKPTQSSRAKSSQVVTPLEIKQNDLHKNKEFMSQLADCINQNSKRDSTEGQIRSNVNKLIKKYPEMKKICNFKYNPLERIVDSKEAIVAELEKMYIELYETGETENGLDKKWALKFDELMSRSGPSQLGKNNNGLEDDFNTVELTEDKIDGFMNDFIEQAKWGQFEANTDNRSFQLRFVVISKYIPQKHMEDIKTRMEETSHGISFYKTYEQISKKYKNELNLQKVSKSSPGIIESSKNSSQTVNSVKWKSVQLSNKQAQPSNRHVFKKPDMKIGGRENLKVSSKNSSQTAPSVQWEKAQPSKKPSFKISDIKIGVHKNLKPFDNLTNEEKLGWIKSHLSESESHEILDKLTDKLTASKNDKLLPPNLEVIFKWLDKSSDCLTKDDHLLSDPEGLFVKQALYHMVGEADYLVNYCEKMPDAYIQQIIKDAVTNPQKALGLLCLLKDTSPEQIKEIKNEPERELINILAPKKELISKIKSDCLAGCQSDFSEGFKNLEDKEKLEWVKNNINTNQATAILLTLAGKIDFRYLSSTASHLYTWLNTHNNTEVGKQIKDSLFIKLYSTYNDQQKLELIKNGINPEQACLVLEMLKSNFDNYKDNNCPPEVTVIYAWLNSCKNSQVKQTAMSALRIKALPFNELDDTEKLVWIKNNVTPEQAYFILHWSGHTLNSKLVDNGLKITETVHGNARENWHASFKNVAEQIESYLINSKSTSWWSSFRNTELGRVKACLFEKAKTTSAEKVKAQINSTYLSSLTPNQLSSNIPVPVQTPPVSPLTPMGKPPSYQEYLMTAANSQSDQTGVKSKKQLSAEDINHELSLLDTEITQKQEKALQQFAPEQKKSPINEGYHNPYSGTINELAQQDNSNLYGESLPSYEDAANEPKPPLYFPKVPTHAPVQPNGSQQKNNLGERVMYS